MRMQKWLIGCVVILSVWTVTSIWLIHKLGFRETIYQKYISLSALTTIKRYLTSTEVRKLQIGAGPNNLPGWLNTDIMPEKEQAFLDATKPFPIPDNSLHYIYSEQVIEHLPFEHSMVMLRECHRTLAPGGKLRLATPDLRKLVALFDQDDTEAKRRFIAAQVKRKRVDPSVKEPERPVFIMNIYLHGFGHQFVYDRQTLQSALESVGFRDVRFLRHDESDDPELRNVERHRYRVGNDIDEYVTMIAQASK